MMRFHTGRHGHGPRQGRRFFLGLAGFFLLLPAMLSAQAAESDLSRFIEQGMELWHVPGMAVTVVSTNEVLFQKGFGTTSIDHGLAVDEHTLFANASTTKAMVVAGVLMLADEGLLSLDDTVSKHLPEVHFNTALLNEQVTIRDLLAHRTGLPSTDFWTFFMNMPLEEQLQRLSAVAPENPLRTGFIYQNTLFEVAGLVIERVSGQRWDRFLQARLWQPIGMTETFGSRSQAPESLARVEPHDFTDGSLHRVDYSLPPDRVDAAGSVWSSIRDMGLWAQFLLRDGVTADGRRLISEAGMADMFRPQTLIPADQFYPVARLYQPNWRSYGLGWFQQDFQGRKIDFHTGSLDGLIALIGLDQAGDRAMVIMGNRDHAEMRHAALLEVMDRTPDTERRDWNREVWNLYRENHESGRNSWAELEASRLERTKPSLPRDAYTGHYENAAMGKVVIELHGQEMLLKTGAKNLPMRHWHLDTFLVEFEQWDLREFAAFRVTPDGTVRGMELFGYDFSLITSRD